MVHFTITAPIDLQQACSEIWIRPDARSGACDILPAEIKAWLTIIVIQKGLLDSRTSNASQIYSTHRNLAWSVVHSSTIRRSPNLSSTAKNRLLYPSPGTTGTSPYYNKKLASQKLPCSKHGIEKKICYYGDLPHFLPRWILAVRPIYGIPGPLHGVSPK